MWQVIIDFLVELGLGLLGVFVRALSDRARAQGVDASLLDYIGQLVDSAEKNPMLDTPEKKFAEVYNDAFNYVSTHYQDVSVSVVRALIELAVQHRKAG